ncbi:MAG: polysaccharide deacetylase family protein [Bacillota bacterium]
MPDQRHIKRNHGQKPDILKCNVTEYTDSFLKSANASGIYGVVQSKQFLNFQSFSSYDMTKGYVERLKKGSIISIKLTGVLDKEEYKAKEEEAKPAMDKQPGIRENDEEIKEEVEITQIVEWLLMAIRDNDYSTEFVKNFLDYQDSNFDRTYEALRPKNNRLDKNQRTELAGDEVDVRDYQQLRIENNGNKAKIITNLYTTQPAVGYVFRGISNKEVLDNVLAVLDRIGAKATFFVTGKEILKYPENVREIANHGHQIGNGGYGMNVANPSNLDFDSLCYEIEMGKKHLKDFLGDAYKDEVNSYYMPLYADIDGDVLEAASALGYKEVVTYNKSAMIRAYRDLSADEIISVYFSNTIALHRGDIVYLRLDYLTQPGAIEELVEKIADVFIKPSMYDITSVNNLMNSDLVYEPVSRTEGVGSNLIKATYDFTEEALLNLVFNRYIGNQSIDTSEELIGFSDKEIEKIDKIGKIDTNGEKVIFLTFDDWGSDTVVMRLLNVLDKYGVKSTFFVRVGNDSLTLQDNFGNPNLLRALALKGHDIGSHTFAHMKIDIITEEDESLLREDIVAAHQEMARYIGDTGALKLFFRPPTLAVSKLGLTTIFDCGYQYIINGDFSTHDYEAESAEELIDKLKNGMGKRSIGDGSIVVMHMSDTSEYTAEALDVVIPYYQAQGYRFAKLSDYLKY